MDRARSAPRDGQARPRDELLRMGREPIPTRALHGRVGSLGTLRRTRPPMTSKRSSRRSGPRTGYRRLSAAPKGRTVARSNTPEHAPGQRSRRRPRCPTHPNPTQRTTEAPRRASRLTRVSIFVSTAPAAGPNRPCLRAIGACYTRNHNPRVGGSSPSSGIAVCRAFLEILACR
jgi:hypothetical protein